MKSKLKIVALGGLGEIGLNMFVLEHNDTIIVIDAGLMFPEINMYGADYVIPSFRYLDKLQHKISGIIITHGHEDHIGAIPFLVKKTDAPIFGTSFSLELIRSKLQDNDVFYKNNLIVISPNDQIRFGEIIFDFIKVDHSIVDGVALSISTPYGRIVHTGDFRINYDAPSLIRTDVEKFASLGYDGVRLLLSDSTNAGVEGCSISQEDVFKTFKDIFSKKNGRIIVSCFASNIIRIQQIIDVARLHHRKIAIDGRSLLKTIEISKKLNFISFDNKDAIELNEIDEYADDEICIISTGSQGETMAGLARMCNQTHKYIKIKKNDIIVFSSKVIPGNEGPINQLINGFYRLGAEVIYETISMIHHSGHAMQKELETMINLTKPEYFIPIHGEYRHLVMHSRIASQCGVKKENILLIDNGQPVCVDEDNVYLGKKVKSGKVLIDGKGVGDVGRELLDERKRLSVDGVVVVKIIFDKTSKYIIYGPQLDSLGFVYERVSGHIIEDSKCIILELIERAQSNESLNINLLKSLIDKELENYFFFVIGRRPVIISNIFEV